MAPFGFIVDGLDDDIEVIDKHTGDRWVRANNNNSKFDEYGDRSFMWDYV